MTHDLLFSITGVVLIGIGLFGSVASTHIIKKLIAINIMGLGIFMIFLSTARHGMITDPIPHAVVLTGIVVAIAGTSLCLWLALKIHLLGEDTTEEVNANDV